MDFIKQESPDNDTETNHHEIQSDDHYSYQNIKSELDDESDSKCSSESDQQAAGPSIHGPVIVIKPENYACSEESLESTDEHSKNHWDSSSIVIKPELDESNQAGGSDTERDESKDITSMESDPTEHEMSDSFIANDREVDEMSQTMDTGDRPFVCLLCNKRFKMSDQLQKHLQTHSGDRTIRCPVCSRGFTQSGHLKVHMRSHTGERPFVCAICNKSFIQACHLNVHMRSHTGERPCVCPTCDRGFMNPSDLRVHMNTHTGVRPHVCPLCGKGFSRSSSLKVHIRSHTGEKPFVCPTCNKGFGHSNRLKTHLKTHNAEETGEQLNTPQQDFVVTH